MDTQLLHRPVSTLAQVRLAAGESIVVEPGAMVGMTPNIDMQTGMTMGGDQKKGLLGKIAGAVLRGQGAKSCGDVL